MKNRLRVLVTQEMGYYIAHCLELDIAVQGKSMAELRDALDHTLLAHVAAALENGLKPFEHVKEAPKHVFDRYENAALKIAPIPLRWNLIEDHHRVKVDMMPRVAELKVA